MEGQIDPRVRANMHTYTEETLAMIPDDRKEEYASVMARIAFSGQAMNNALAAVSMAQKNIVYAEDLRAEFFESIWNTNPALQPAPIV